MAEQMKKRVIALGFFDGVHKGHQALLQVCRDRAASLGAASCAVTFDRHPLSVILGEPFPLLVEDASLRVFLLTEVGGMDEALVLPFDKAMADMPYEAFVRDLLISKLHACHLVMGEGYTCGKGGLGTAPRVAALCRELSVGCDIIPNVLWEGEPISSTRIRNLLLSGKTGQAKELLGHDFLSCESGIRIGGQGGFCHKRRGGRHGGH